MTISEILQNVTILDDCTKTLTGGWDFIMGTGAFVALFGISFLVIRFRESFCGERIVEIAFAVLGLLTMAFGLWGRVTVPLLQIDYYICANDVKIEQLVEYFDINELSKVDDSVVCHITPKVEYYDEVLKIRATDKED